MMMVRLSATPKRLQPMRRSKKCAVSRRVFSISGPAVGASIDRFFATRPPLADVVCRREGGERRADWPHPAMFPCSLLLSPRSMRRREAIVHVNTAAMRTVHREIAMTDHRVARRTVIKSAGLSIGAGLASGIASANAQAPAAQAAAPAAQEIWSGEYWAHKANVKLAMFRKRLTTPAANEPRQPVLFLVHGSSNAARSSYDLTVPGTGEYSMVNAFARYGYNVWIVDPDCSRNSHSSGNNSDIASGVEDLKAAMTVVMAETGQQKIHFYGTSSGGIRAAAYAQAQPDRVDRLILSAFTYKGEGAEEIQRRQKNIESLRANPRRKRHANTTRSNFTRDGHPAIYDPAVAETIIAAEMKFGDTIP